MIRITDLTSFWPKTPVIKKKTIRNSSTQMFIGEYDPIALGFPVYELKGRRQMLRIKIPVSYRHAQRFLNFKNSCYIAALKAKVVLPQDPDAKRTILTVMDGMQRNLVFNDAVRTKFFAEVKGEFYKGRGGARLEDNLGGPFRSMTMDTWLVDEYELFAHDPSACATLKRTAPYSKDPLRIGKSDHHSRGSSR